MGMPCVAGGRRGIYRRNLNGTDKLEDLDADGMNAPVSFAMSVHEFVCIQQLDNCCTDSV